MKPAVVQAQRCETRYPNELVAFAAAARSHGLTASAVGKRREGLWVAVVATMSYRERRRVDMPESRGRTKSGVA